MAISGIMARQARIVVPGAAHHVTQRGNNRQDIFFVDGDRRVYLCYLRESAVKYGLGVSAYCLMTNHVHLVVIPEREESLAKALGRAHLMYAQYVHRLHGRLGHFWQSRFYSCPMDDAHAHNAAAYVELNPVRAGLCGHAWEYPWSSAAVHCGDGQSPGLLALDSWFRQMPPEEWKATLEAIGSSAETIECLRLHTRTGRPLGGDFFLSKLETLLNRRFRIVHTGRPKGSKDKSKRKRRDSRKHV
jgi:putative transposase